MEVNPWIRESSRIFQSEFGTDTSGKGKVYRLNRLVQIIKVFFDKQNLQQEYTWILLGDREVKIYARIARDTLRKFHTQMTSSFLSIDTMEKTIFKIEGHKFVYDQPDLLSTHLAPQLCLELTNFKLMTISQAHSLLKRDGSRLEDFNTSASNENGWDLHREWIRTSKLAGEQDWKALGKSIKSIGGLNKIPTPVDAVRSGDAKPSRRVSIIQSRFTGKPTTSNKKVVNSMSNSGSRPRPSITEQLASEENEAATPDSLKISTQAPRHRTRSQSAQPIDKALHLPSSLDLSTCTLPRPYQSQQPPASLRDRSIFDYSVMAATTQSEISLDIVSQISGQPSTNQQIFEGSTKQKRMYEIGDESDDTKRSKLARLDSNRSPESNQGSGQLLSDVEKVDKEGKKMKVERSVDVALNKTRARLLTRIKNGTYKTAVPLAYEEPPIWAPTPVIRVPPDFQLPLSTTVNPPAPTIVRTTTAAPVSVPNTSISAVERAQESMLARKGARKSSDAIDPTKAAIPSAHNVTTSESAIVEITRGTLDNERARKLMLARKKAQQMGVEEGIDPNSPAKTTTTAIPVPAIIEEASIMSVVERTKQSLLHRKAAKSSLVMVEPVIALMAIEKGAKAKEMSSTTTGQGMIAESSLLIPKQEEDGGGQLGRANSVEDIDLKIARLMQERMLAVRRESASSRASIDRVSDDRILRVSTPHSEPIKLGPPANPTVVQDSAFSGAHRLQNVESAPVIQSSPTKSLSNASQSSKRNAIGSLTTDVSKRDEMEIDRPTILDVESSRVEAAPALAAVPHVTALPVGAPDQPLRKDKGDDMELDLPAIAVISEESDQSISLRVVRGSSSVAVEADAFTGMKMEMSEKEVAEEEEQPVKEEIKAKTPPRVVIRPVNQRKRVLVDGKSRIERVYGVKLATFEEFEKEYNKY